MSKVKYASWGVILVLFFSLLISGCAGAFMSPEFSYQGRLTDSSGQPVNGDYSIQFSIYNDDTAGTELYTETENVTVENGLFDTAVGPTSAVGSLSPADLAQPLWVEVEVGDGTITETLTPRQRLYGAPYAFTLMPGAVISQTLQYQGYSTSGVSGIVTVENDYDGDGDFGSGGSAALPALNVVGETGIQLSSPTGDSGTIYTERGNTDSDLNIHSNDQVRIFLDEDDNDVNGYFYIYGNGTDLCRIEDDGDLFCTGTITADNVSRSVTVDDQPRQVYAVESPEVWMEDFGGGVLENGSAEVAIDALFAETVSLEDYHVYVTPLGDCGGLYVSNKTAAGFEVHELGGGNSNVAFDYRIVAHRTGYDQVRMPVDNSFSVEEVDE